MKKTAFEEQIPLRPSKVLNSILTKSNFDEPTNIFLLTAPSGIILFEVDWRELENEGRKTQSETMNRLQAVKSHLEQTVLYEKIESDVPLFVDVPASPKEWCEAVCNVADDILDSSRWCFLIIISGE